MVLVGLDAAVFAKNLFYPGHSLLLLGDDIVRGLSQLVHDDEAHRAVRCMVSVVHSLVLELVACLVSELPPANRIKIDEFFDVFDICAHIDDTVEDGLSRFFFTLLEIFCLCGACFLATTFLEEVLPVDAEHHL